MAATGGRGARLRGLAWRPPVELVLAPPQFVHQDRELAGDGGARLLAAKPLLQPPSPARKAQGRLTRANKLLAAS